MGRRPRLGSRTGSIAVHGPDSRRPEPRRSALRGLVVASVDGECDEVVEGAVVGDVVAADVEVLESGEPREGFEVCDVVADEPERAQPSALRA